MNPKRVTRKLRAILSADVQGYSRLMGDDEVATFKTITEYREIFSSIVNQYNGRVVDSPGDNILSEFASVVDAVQCAVEIQKVLKAKNEGLPENRRMIFRIGVNLGDVIHEDDRIYGDGVNIAARIESLADGGGICISGTAYDQIENKLALGYNYFGEHSVKNIAKPIRVYKVPMDPKDVVKKTKPKLAKNAAIAVAIAIILVAAAIVWNSYLRPAPIPTKAISKKTSSTDESTNKPPLPNSDKRSIAVLPFTNMSGDPKEQYLCDGFTEHIITVLAKISDLSVTARNTTFTYKGTPVNIQKLGKELKVKYVLEGSIQKSGNRIRVTAQLIDTATGNHLWAENYDRNIEDIFDLQDEIALKISQSLHVKLVGGTGMNPCARGTDNVDAYLKFIQAMHYHNLGDIEGLNLSIKMCEEAIELDPNYGPAYSLLAWENLNEIGLCVSSSPKQSMAKAFELAQKALSVNNSCPFAHETMGAVYIFMGQNDKALEQFNKAIEMDSNWPDIYVIRCYYLIRTGKLNEALISLKKAFRLNPLPPPWYFTFLGRAYTMLERYDEAILAFESALKISPRFLYGHMFLSFVYAILGDEENTRFQVSEILKINPHFSFGCFRPFVNSYKDAAIKKRLTEGLQKAGLPYEEASKIPEKPSIAVLAFDNMSGDPNQEYFSDGMSEDLITDLSKISDILVKSRKSSFVFKGKQLGIKEIGKKLGVRYVLEGSVRRSGNRIRINAQLINAATGDHLWAERYDENVTDIFDIQDKITKKIVAALALKLTPDEQERIADKGTNNIAAYDALLKARANFNMATVEGYKNAISLFEKAIKLDPNYGAAYAGLAGVYDTLSHLAVNRKQLGMSYEEIRLKEREALNAGLKHNPVAKTYSTNSVMLAFQYRPEEALAEAKKAQMMAPNDPNVLWQLAPAHFVNGKPEIGINLAKKALELDPACLF